MIRTTLAALAATAVALALAPAAGAHVTLQPGEAPAGEFTRLDVRVPNERDDKGTTKVDVQFPDGFPSASYEPVPGWRVRVTREELDTPLSQHGEEITEQVSRITWTGDGEQGRIGPGQFKDFGLSVQIPDRPGSALTFKALQTYEGGEVVRWIGAPDSDEPAPRVEVTEGESEQHGAAGEEEQGEEPEAVETEQAAGASDDDDEDSDTLPIIALIVGGLGLVTGGAALVRSRRRP